MANKWMIIAILACAAGCGPKLVPVSGQVTWNGKPLEYAMIVFFPENPSMPTASGSTRADGNFSLLTAQPKSQPGAFPGKYKVTVTKTETIVVIQTGNQIWKQVDRLPLQYKDRAETPLTVEVPKEGVTDLRLALTGDVTEKQKVKGGTPVMPRPPQAKDADH